MRNKKNDFYDILIEKMTMIYRDILSYGKTCDFLDELDRIGVRSTVLRPYSRHLAKRNEEKPTLEMKKSQEYFEANRDRINNILQILADEESRNTYEAMIRFRCKSEFEKLPKDSGVYQQYFFNDFFKYKKGECLVDGGAFIGDTVRRFQRCMKDNDIDSYQIIAFEPIKDAYDVLHKKYPDIISYNAGLWNSNCRLEFIEDQSGSHIIESIDNIEIDSKSKSFCDVKAIDLCDECRDVSLIKMDIEGAEMQALEGARMTILRNRPKLAICIYHSDEDMIRIAEYIHMLVPEYRLYVRQHTQFVTETVLYATI